MLRVVLLFISFIFLTGCSQYKSNFGGYSHKYQQAKMGSSLEYPKELKVLSASNRYTIPYVKYDPQQEWIKFLPPDYR
jgi:uncharacterized lipoprotein